MMCHPVTPPTPTVFVAYPTSLVTIALHVALIAVLAWLVLDKRRELAELRRAGRVNVVNNVIEECRRTRRVVPKLPNSGGAK